MQGARGNFNKNQLNLLTDEFPSSLSLFDSPPSLHRRKAEGGGVEAIFRLLRRFRFSNILFPVAKGASASGGGN